MVTQITPVELAEALDAEEPMALVDTRQPDSFDGWHLHEATNVPFDPREGFDDDALETVQATTDAAPVRVICAKGLTSTPFAFELEQRGYEDVAVVKGGMEDWSKVYELAPIETGDSDLKLIQLQRRAKGCLGYVVGSMSTGEAAIIDAPRQDHEFELAAAEAGLTIRHVLDTHVHADHLSGGPGLAERLDVPYYLGARANERDVSHSFVSLADGDTIEFGDVVIEARHAPGHTTEMMNYLINGEYLLTGDTLFVESVGRTELQFGEDGATDGADLMYDTIHDEILTLPDETAVLPGHVSVSEDNRYEVGAPGEPIQRTIDTLRTDLDLLDLDRASFVEEVAENAPDKPPNYETVIAINRGEEEPESEAEATELEIGPNNCAA